MIEEVVTNFDNISIHDRRKQLLDEVLETIDLIEKICIVKNINFNKLKSENILRNKNSLYEEEFLHLMYIYVLYLKEDLGLLLKDLI